MLHFKVYYCHIQGGNVSFPDEAIQGINFFSAQVNSLLYHEWPKAKSGMKMNQRVLRKKCFWELPHLEKAFSYAAINKLA